MLWNASAIKDYGISEKDGDLGSVKDLLFDDAKWVIRWLVVDAGKWLPGRKVLLSPSVLGKPDAETRQFPVKLTKQQVKDSPPYDPAITVDGAYDEKHLAYYSMYDLPI
jgi:hypothetical protein